MWYLKNYNPLLAGSIDGTDTLPHDHGIVRAINSYYTLKKPIIANLTSNSLKTLFVGRLNENINEEDIKKVFSKYGKIKNIRIVLDIVTGLSRGYGFVEYESEKDCKKAYNDGDKILINGSKVIIDYERSRTMKDWIPRRFGGGFGGKKESGQLRFGSIDRPFKEPINIGENQKMPEISRNQKYSDCWRDYIYDKERKKHDKKSKDEKEDDNKQTEEKIHHDKKHYRHSTEDYYSSHHDKYSSKDYKDENKSHSSHSNKRQREDKYKDDDNIIKKKRTEDEKNNIIINDRQSSLDSKNHKYERSRKDKRRRSRSRSKSKSRNRNRSRSRSRNKHSYSHSHRHHHSSH